MVDQTAVTATTFIEGQDEEPVDPARNETVIAENVSFEEFLTRFAEVHAEWLMGKVILVVTNNLTHNVMLGFLYSLLNLYLGLKHMGRVLLAGFPMLISKTKPGREPDLMVVFNDKVERIKFNHLDGAADIVVEIVSPESTKRDRGDKFAEYEAAGVQEYWLIDPIRRETVLYALGEDKHYHPLPTDSEGKLVSRLLPGFALHPDLLWREAPPDGAELIELAQHMAEQ